VPDLDPMIFWLLTAILGKLHRVKRL